MEELRDELVRALSPSGSVSARVLSATNLVREAVARHGTSPTASVALGRSLMGALLLATDGQDGERLQLQVRGDGPLGTITVTADSEGTVRGYVQHPAANPPLRGEELGVSGAIGLGALSVERNHASWKQPYRGVVPLVASEIAQDLARYLLESEQKPSVVALGVYLGRDGDIEAAGGYLVRPLPGADEADVGELERRVEGTLHPSELLRNGVSAESILARLVGAAAPGDIERLEPRFECPCNVGRVRRAALLLGRAEIREIVEQGEELEVRCAFCAEVYRIAPDDLGSLMPDA